MYLMEKTYTQKIMIIKIKPEEYLKRYDNSSAGERSAYESRVGEWLRNGAPLLMNRASVFDAKLQSAVAMSAGWNDPECRAFEEGALLLSALMGRCDTWLPDMLYVKAAARCIKKMCTLLGEVVANAQPETTQDGTARQEAQEEGRQAPFRHQPDGDHKGEIQDGHKTGAAVTPLTGAAIPARPTHIDQYVHLLPKKTQERAANYGPLMRELDEMREKQRLLMDADGVGAKDREAVAKRIVAIDKELGTIRKELDAGWQALVESGRVVVDDLGMARILPGADTEDAEDTPATELTSEQKARRRNLRKWLVDTRRGNGNVRDKHVAEWKEYFLEFAALDGDKAYEDGKVTEAAAHYGIDLAALRTKQ